MSIQTLEYKSGYKYQLESTVRWKLVNKFTIKKEFKSRYYSLRKIDGAWWLIIHAQAAWDGATMYPDCKWLMPASLIHDYLHHVIAKGIIPESQNDLIDAELAEVIKVTHYKKSWFDKIMDRFRPWYVEKATNLVNEKVNPGKPVHTIEFGE